ncbi:hypothetical protein SUDANB58_04051 [Streptomyces sp. enrichment culture]
MAKAMATDDDAARHGTRPREPGMIQTRGPSDGRLLPAPEGNRQRLDMLLTLTGACAPLS